MGTPTSSHHNGIVTFNPSFQFYPPTPKYLKTQFKIFIEKKTREVWEKTNMDSNSSFPLSSDLKKTYIFKDTLDNKSLLSFSKVSKIDRELVKEEIVNRLNNRNISFAELGPKGLRSVCEIMGYFGHELCAKITRLDLIQFDTVNFNIDQLHILPATFPNVEWLSLGGWPLTNVSLIHLREFKHLKSLDISYCRLLKDLSYLEQCSLTIEHLNLRGLINVEDISFLRSFTKLKTLDLNRCEKNFDFTFCKEWKKTDYLRWFNFGAVGQRLKLDKYLSSKGVAFTSHNDSSLILKQKIMVLKKRDLEDEWRTVNMEFLLTQKVIGSVRRVLEK